MLKPNDFRVAAYVQYVDGAIVLFASNRDALLRAAPEFRSLILDEISSTEYRRPCWLAIEAEDEDDAAAGTCPVPGAPRWWLALWIMPQTTSSLKEGSTNGST